MPTQSTHTALFLFLRQESEELRVKGWGRRKRMLRLLNRRIYRLAKGSGLPVFVISGNRQVGSDFGERFAHAFQQVFAKGYQQVIALGNDCPGLTTKHLQAAVAALNESPMVIGPDGRGGAYLIGLQREAFHADTFRKLPWQQSHLLEGLRSYSCDHASLDSLQDANKAVELVQQLIRLPTSDWKKLLLAFWSHSIPTIVAFQAPIAMTSAGSTCLHRGPPSLC